MRVDEDLLNAMPTYLAMLPSVEGPIDATRVFPGCAEHGLCQNYAKSEDLDRLCNPTSQLNDVCINLGSTVIHSNLWDDSTSKCAIFSSFIMKYIEDDANPHTIWKNTRFLSYWEQKIWLIPIHRQIERHWILCVVHLEEGEMHIFDSFASQGSCHSIIKASLLTMLQIVLTRWLAPL